MRLIDVRWTTLNGLNLRQNLALVLSPGLGPILWCLLCQAAEIVRVLHAGVCWEHLWMLRASIVAGAGRSLWVLRLLDRRHRPGPRAEPRLARLSWFRAQVSRGRRLPSSLVLLRWLNSAASGG